MGGHGARQSGEFSPQTQGGQNTGDSSGERRRAMSRTSNRPLSVLRRGSPDDGRGDLGRGSALSHVLPGDRLWRYADARRSGTDKRLDRTIIVRFDANVAPGMPWDFQPVQRTLELKIGENALAFYKAHNTSKETVKGTASFNVSPDNAGAFFAKIECFCFTEQTLAPGESVDMPVSFFVDPSILEDRDARVIKEITLSYTFFPVTGSGAKAEAPKGRLGPRRPAREVEVCGAQGCGLRMA